MPLRASAAPRPRQQPAFPPPSAGKSKRESQAEAFYRLGALNFELGLYERAVMQFRRAVALDASVAAHHAGLGRSLARLGRGSDAVLCYREAVRVDPADADALNGLGGSLVRAGQFGEAVAPLLEAIHLRPEYPEAFNNLGAALLELGQYADALQCYEHAVRLRPRYAQARNSLGAALERLGRIPEALVEYGRAVRLEPDYVQAHVNRGMALLLSGDFASGWPEYEWRLKAAPNRGEIRSAAPRWDGAPIAGKTILLHAEQGLGDTIQFFRYVPMLERLGARVVVECQPRLTALLGAAAGEDRVFAAGSPAPPHDCHLPLLSLPWMFGTTIDAVPAAAPYLRVPQAHRRAWAERLGTRGGLRVGLVWAGNPSQDNDRRRSMRLADFAPLAAVPGIRLFSLQKGPRAADRPPDGLLVEAVELESGGILDTAAIVENLDLTITVDTMPAHLAGALNRPVWTLLPFAPDWRWLRGRSDSPWYPSMRLFRQTAPGDWAPVVVAVADRLRRFPAGGFRNPQSPPI